MVEEGLLLAGKGEVREGHHFLGQVGREVLVHARVPGHGALLGSGQ